MAGSSPEKSSDSILHELGEGFLTCSICLEQFKAPKILPCHHTFCQPCLKTVVGQGHGRLDCPTCRKPCQLSGDGVPALENNFFMNSLLELVDKRPKKDAAQANTCEWCQETVASSICIDCNQKCCGNCAKAHGNTKLTSTHKVLSLDAYKDAKVKNPATVQPATFCSVHKQNKVEFFCDTCQAPVCTACTVVNHRVPDHSHRDLQEVADEYTAKLSEIVGKFQVKAKEAGSSKTAARQTCEDLKQWCDEQKKNAQEIVEEKLRKVKLEGEKLQNEIDSAYKQKLKKAEALVSDLEFKYGNIVSMRSYLETLIQQGNAIHLMSATKDAMGRIEDLQKTETVIAQEKNKSFEILDLEKWDVLKSDVCVPKCSIQNEANRIGKDQTETFFITTRDSGGKDIIPRQPINVKVTKLSGSDVALKVAYCADGVHAVKVDGGLASGKCRVDVTISEQPVPGSPFDIYFIQSAPPARPPGSRSVLTSPPPPRPPPSHGRGAATHPPTVPPQPGSKSNSLPRQKSQFDDIPSSSSSQSECKGNSLPRTEGQVKVSHQPPPPPPIQSPGRSGGPPPPPPPSCTTSGGQPPPVPPQPIQRGDSLPRSENIPSEVKAQSAPPPPSGGAPPPSSARPKTGPPPPPPPPGRGQPPPSPSPGKQKGVAPAPPSSQGAEAADKQAPRKPPRLADTRTASIPEQVAAKTKSPPPLPAPYGSDASASEQPARSPDTQLPAKPERPADPPPSPKPAAPPDHQPPPRRASRSPDLSSKAKTDQPAGAEKSPADQSASDTVQSQKPDAPPPSPGRPATLPPKKPPKPTHKPVPAPRQMSKDN